MILCRVWVGSGGEQHSNQFVFIAVFFILSPRALGGSSWAGDKSREMLMNDFPGITFFDEDHRGARLFFDGVRSSLEVVVENEGGDAHLAENIDLQVVGPHGQPIDRLQSLVLAPAGRCRVLSAMFFAGELCELRSVKVITVEPIQIFFLGGLKDLLQSSLDLR